MRAPAWIVASVFCLAGCATTTTVVRRQAALDLECEQEQLVVQPEKSRFRVVGCGVNAAYACWREAAVMHCRRVGQRGVPHARREALVREKASKRLGCEAEALAIEPQGEHYLVRGCGRRVEYECGTRADCCAFTHPGVQPDATRVPTLATPDTADTPQGADERGKAKGSLSKAHIRAVIDAGLDRIRACYEAELRRTEGLAGIVRVQFIIAPEGHVRVAVLSGSSLGVPTVEQCIVEATKLHRFAKPAGGGIVVVTYPYSLQLEPPGPHAACE